MINVTPEIAAKHYEEHLGKPFYEKLIRFITMGPIVAMVVEGKNAELYEKADYWLEILGDG